jgi:hypothetical protein
MLARRLLLLAAVLMLLTALAASIAPRDLTGGEDDPPVVRGPGALPAGDTITEEIPAAPGSNSRITVSRGDTLQLQVAGDVFDSVLLERLDMVDGIEPTTPARFDILIDSPPGSYPIRLVDADRRIGSIVISD